LTLAFMLDVEPQIDPVMPLNMPATVGPIITTINRMTSVTITNTSPYSTRP